MLLRFYLIFWFACSFVAAFNERDAKDETCPCPDLFEKVPGVPFKCFYVTIINWWMRGMAERMMADCNAKSIDNCFYNTFSYPNVPIQMFYPNVFTTLYSQKLAKVFNPLHV